MEDTHKHFKFNGKGWALFKLNLANFFLTLITLGIYFFWAKVRVHRFFYYHTTFDNGNFDFHATGKEIFILFLKSILITIPVTAGIGGLAYLLYKSGLNIQIFAAVIAFFFYAGIFALIPLAVNETRKFMLARTSWNLKHFSFDGKLKNLYLIYLKGFLLSVITFGIYGIWFRVNLKKYLINNSGIDNKTFSYRGNGKEIFFIFLPSVILIPLTLGFYTFWLIAKFERYQWAHTFFDNTRFETKITGGGLLKVLFLNFLQTIFTGGIGYPWAVVRQKKYIIESLELTNEIVPEISTPLPEKKIKNATRQVKTEVPPKVNEKDSKTLNSSQKSKTTESDDFKDLYSDFFE